MRIQCTVLVGFGVVARGMACRSTHFMERACGESEKVSNESSNFGQCSGYPRTGAFGTPPCQGCFTKPCDGLVISKAERETMVRVRAGQRIGSCQCVRCASWKAGRKKAERRMFCLSPAQHEVTSPRKLKSKRRTRGKITPYSVQC